MIDIKSSKEIDIMRRCGKITAKILDELTNICEPGMTGNLINTLVNKRCAELEVTPSFLGYKGYPASICVSINDGIVHCIPNDIKFKVGDLVKLDFGVCLQGYHTDSARTIVIGSNSKGQILADTVKTSLHLAIDQARDNNKVGDISNAIQSYIEANGYHIPKAFCGHGIGRQLHMEPEVHNFGKKNTGPVLKKGMTIAIEPIANLTTPYHKRSKDGWSEFTLDNNLSAHFEHTILITDDLPEILTLSN